ncbi:MAG: metallophosphoesterase family protein, partial [Acidimicrobiales bacterium]
MGWLEATPKHMPSTKSAGRPVPGPAGTPARILVAGDTHGNIGWISTLAKLAARHDCAGILQLGDFGFWPDKRHTFAPVLNERFLNAVATEMARYGVWLRVIDGNHDAVPLVLDRYEPGPDGIVSLRSWLLDWATRGSRWEWAGVRFGALGGAVSIDRRMRTPGWSWWATEMIWPEDVERLGTGKLDVLCTHEAPEGVCQPGVDLASLPVQLLQEETDSRACRRLVEQARRNTKPALLLHGHHHLRYWGHMDLDDVETVVEGLGCDMDANGDAWGVLRLPNLGFADGWEIDRAKASGREPDSPKVGRG